MDIKEYIDKLSKLIDDTKSYVNDISIVSSKEGIKLFENWENESKNKYGMFKKVELPDSSSRVMTKSI